MIKVQEAENQIIAAYIGVARGTLSRLLNERARITPEMSIKITQAFGLPSSDLLFRLQNKYDFWQAAHRVKRRKIATLKQIRMAKADRKSTRLNSSHLG